MIFWEACTTHFPGALWKRLERAVPPTAPRKQLVVSFLLPTVFNPWLMRNHLISAVLNILCINYIILPILTVVGKHKDTHTHIHVSSRSSGSKIFFLLGPHKAQTKSHVKCPGFHGGFCSEAAQVFPPPQDSFLLRNFMPPNIN